jgi:hypothetical protein
MKNLKITTAVAAATLALSGLAATTATAQPWRDYDRHEQYSGNLTTSYVDSLEWRIRNAADEGRISWGQARQLQRDLSAVQPLAWRVQTGQASQWEYRRLSNVVNRIEAATNNYPRYSDNRRWR